MASRALLVAKPAEVDALLEASRARDDLHPIACPRGQGALEALESEPPDLALVRMQMPEVDGLDLLRRIRARAPSARVVMLLDPADVRFREALFRSSADEAVFTPLDAADAMVRLVGGAENRFRRAPRIPLTVRGRLLLDGGEKEAMLESLSELGVRLRWSEAAPAQAAVPLVAELVPGDGERTFWVRFQDLAQKKGVPEALLARFIALGPDEAAAVQSALGKLRGARGGPLESAPEGPARYEPREDEPGSGAVWQPLPPEPAVAPRRGVLRAIGAGVLAVAAAGAVAGGWRAWRALRRPDLAYEPNPAGVYEGLRVRRFNQLGPRLVAMADASWSDLAPGERHAALRALAAEGASRKGVERVEVWTLKGQVGVAELHPDGGDPTITIP